MAIRLTMLATMRCHRHADRDESAGVQLDQPGVRAMERLIDHLGRSTAQRDSSSCGETICDHLWSHVSRRATSDPGDFRAAMAIWREAVFANHDLVLDAARCRWNTYGLPEDSNDLRSLDILLLRTCTQDADATDFGVRIRSSAGRLGALDIMTAGPMADGACTEIENAMFPETDDPFHKMIHPNHFPCLADICEALPSRTMARSVFWNAWTSDNEEQPRIVWGSQHIRRAYGCATGVMTTDAAPNDASSLVVGVHGLRQLGIPDHQIGAYIPASSAGWMAACFLARPVVSAFSPDPWNHGLAHLLQCQPTDDIWDAAERVMPKRIGSSRSDVIARCLRSTLDDQAAPGEQAMAARVISILSTC